MNNVSVVNYKDCFSCRSCFLSCPKNAIEMIENEEGFFYPKVTEDKCIDCGICVKKCPSLNKVERENFEQYGLAVVAKDKNVLLKSSSGAASSIIANKIVTDGGVVFGSAYDDNLFVQHIACKDFSELEKIKGSKYVESFTGDTFKETKEYLENGQKVLYTGSPCQIAGLKKYLGKDYENLYTLDLICHGVPSRKLFLKYLEWLGNRNNGKIIYYGFRDKDVGGWSCGGKIKTKTKTKIVEGACDPYYATFLRGETYRESCYSCPFANTNRISDITIGDYWGVKKNHPEIPSENGVSCIIINSKKGLNLFNATKSSFNCYETKIENIVEKNLNLSKPVQRPFVRSSIYLDIDRIDERIYFKKYKRKNFVGYRIHRILSRMFPMNLKNRIKAILGRKR